MINIAASTPIFSKKLTCHVRLYSCQVMDPQLILKNKKLLSFITPFSFFFLFPHFTLCRGKSLNKISFKTSPISFYHSQKMKKSQVVTKGNQKIKVNDVWEEETSASCFCMCSIFGTVSLNFISASI